jgi:hypothetical protein
MASGDFGFRGQIVSIDVNDKCRSNIDGKKRRKIGFGGLPISDG